MFQKRLINVQKCLLNDSYLFDTCIKQLSSTYQTFMKHLPNNYQAFIKPLAKLYETCVKHLANVYQTCSKHLSSMYWSIWIWEDMGGYGRTKAPWGVPGGPRGVPGGSHEVTQFHTIQNVHVILTIYLDVIILVPNFHTKF